MAQNKSKKIMRWYRRNKKTIGIILLLFLFPLLIGGIYALPLPQIIAVDSGDLLAYYGTAFGIFGSFVVYRDEIKKQKKERTKELKPLFFVDVKIVDNSAELFNVIINNRSEKPLSFLYFYDEFVETRLQESYSFQVTYNKTIEQVEKIKPRFNITMDSDIIDLDGYPKYIQILCDDIDGNMWNCCYYKVKDCEKVYYYPSDFEII